MKAVEMSAEQKVELGKKVADLKAYLNNVENDISNNNMEGIDFDTLNTKANDLLSITQDQGQTGQAQNQTDQAKTEPVHQATSHTGVTRHQDKDESASGTTGVKSPGAASDRSSHSGRNK